MLVNAGDKVAIDPSGATCCNRITLKRLLTTTIAMATFCFLSETVKAVTIVNGSFEDISGAYINVPDTDQMTSVVADGWTTSLNSPDWFWGEGPANRYHTPYGDHFAVAVASGNPGGVYREGLSQVVTGLAIGETYSVSFSHANGQYFQSGTSSYDTPGIPGGWEVLIDGTTIAMPMLAARPTRMIQTPLWSFCR